MSSVIAWRLLASERGKLSVGPYHVIRGGVMSFNTIKTEERDGIYIITLNRPKAKNAMNSEMWQELC